MVGARGALLALVRTSLFLPAPMANPLLTGPSGETLTSPDLWFDDVGLAVMVQSRRFHADGPDWEATVEQGSDLSTVRVVVVGVTPSCTRARPESQCAASSAAHEAAARSGVRAPVTAPVREHRAPRGRGLNQTREMVLPDHPCSRW